MTVAQPGEQRGGWLVGWVLRYQAAFERGFQDRLAEGEQVPMKSGEILLGKCCFLLQSYALHYFSHLNQAWDRHSSRE